MIIVVSYAPDDSRYPRAGRPDRQHDVYWQSIAVHAATLRHVARDDLVFEVHCPTPPPRQVLPLLDAARVDHVETPFRHRPPDNFFERFVGSLYLLDTADAIAQEAADDSVVLFVDPDVVWVDDPHPLIEEVRRSGIVTYDLGLPNDFPIGDLTRHDEAELIEAITGATFDSLPPHFGGELYGVLGARLRELVAHLAPLWEATLRRHQDGRLHFNYEEHLFDAALWQLGVMEGRGNRYLERIMTIPAPFGSRERYRPELLAWHLPSEKTVGIANVYARLAAGRGLPTREEGYHTWLRRRMGIRRTPRHLVRDVMRWVKWTATGEARRARRRGQVGGL